MCKYALPFFQHKSRNNSCLKIWCSVHETLRLISFLPGIKKFVRANLVEYSVKNCSTPSSVSNCLMRVISSVGKMISEDWSCSISWWFSIRSSFWSPSTRSPTISSYKLSSLNYIFLLFFNFQLFLLDLTKANTYLDQFSFIQIDTMQWILTHFSYLF